MHQQSLKIECTASDGKIFIRIADIFVIEAAGNHSYIYGLSSDRIFVTNSLKDLSDRLHGFGFCRVHRQFLVNIRRIHKYQQTEGGCIEMEDGKKYPLSKNGKILFWEMMKKETL